MCFKMNFDTFLEHKRIIMESQQRAMDLMKSTEYSLDYFSSFSVLCNTLQCGNSKVGETAFFAPG